MNIFTAVKYCCILHGRVFIRVPTFFHTHNVEDTQFLKRVSTYFKYPQFCESTYFTDHDFEYPQFLAHLSRRLKGELIVYQSSRRLCVCVSCCVSVCQWTFSNSNISATSGPIVTKFYLNHHWGGGKAALGFGPDRIGTLVSMATDSSHRVIMGKML